MKRIHSSEIFISFPAGQERSGYDEFINEQREEFFKSLKEGTRIITDKDGKVSFAVPLSDTSCDYCGKSYPSEKGRCTYCGAPKQ